MLTLFPLILVAFVTSPQDDTPEIPLEEVVTWLEGFRSEHGRAPSLQEFNEKTTLPSGVVGISRESRVPALEAFSRTQQPIISGPDLIELYKSTRASISDLHMTVELNEYEFTGDTRELMVSTVHEFASSGRKTMLKKSPSDAVNWSVLAYDENAQRSYQVQGKGKFGSVQQYGGRSAYFRPKSNVLFGSMLLDSVDCTQMELAFHDLCLFLSQEGVAVTEQLLERDGVECVVAGNPGQEVWMDPARNFAVVYFVNYTHPPDGPRKPTYECILEDLRDCGNGIWLPGKMTRRNYDKPGPAGKLVKESVAVVTSLSVNEPLPNSLFSEVIPEGTVVLDRLQDLTYVSGVNGSIEQLLTEEFTRPAVEQKFDGRFILINSLVLLLILGFFGFWHFRRKSHV